MGSLPGAFPHHYHLWTTKVVALDQEQQSGKLPKSQEIYDVMDKKFGLCKSTGWQGVKIKYMEEADEIEDLGLGMGKLGL